MQNNGRAPALLVHSSGMSSRQWKRLAAQLSPARTVVAPDLIGSGEQPAWPDDAPFHFEQDVDSLEQKLRALQSPAHVVGHSYGGFLAITLARRVPELVCSLSLYDPVAYGVLYDADDRVGLDDLLPAIRDFGDDRGGERWYESFVDYWNGVGTWRSLPEVQRHAFLRTGRKVWYEVTTLLDDRTPRDAYRVLTMPVLFLTGDKSPAAAQRVIAQLVATLPNARSEVIAGAGHMGPISHAAQVNALIEQHLDASE